MNKKIFGAIVCIGLLTLCAFPVIDASAEESPLRVTVNPGLIAIKKDVTIYINNTGDTTLENVTYNISVNRRGIFNRPIGNATGKFATLAPGDEVNVTVNTFAFLWTFFIRATINVTADGLAEPVLKSVKGVAFLGFVRLRRIQLLP